MAGKKNCGFEVQLDNGQSEIFLDPKKARKRVKFHEGKAVIVRSCVIGQFQDGKKKK